MVFRRKAQSQVLITEADGASTLATRRVIRVVGPASYSIGGFGVDASAYFSRIVKATYLRAYTTTTDARAMHMGTIESDTGHLFSAAKFNFVMHRALYLHTHTYNAPNANTGDANHVSGVDVPRHTIGTTPTSATSATASTQQDEMAATTNLSTITFEFEVEGVAL